MSKQMYGITDTLDTSVFEFSKGARGGRVRVWEDGDPLQERGWVAVHVRETAYGAGTDAAGDSATTHEYLVDVRGNWLYAARALRDVAVALEHGHRERLNALVERADDYEDDGTPVEVSAIEAAAIITGKVEK